MLNEFELEFLKNTDYSTLYLLLHKLNTLCDLQLKGYMEDSISTTFKNIDVIIEAMSLIEGRLIVNFGDVKLSLN